MDIKRTILWIIMAFSVIMLWDNWQRHNGQPSMFGLPPTGTAPVHAQPPQATDNSVPTAALQTATGAAGAVSAASVPGADIATHGEVVTITTDVFKADIDTLGGEIKQLELLREPDTVDPSHNLVLMGSSAGRTYVAQSGLIGGAFPTHKTLFAATAGERTMAAGDGKISLVLAAEENGVKLVKTYTFTRGSYNIAVQNAVTNDSAAPVTPSLYLQLVRDGAEPAGQQRFSHAFTGGAVYTDANKFQKFTFEKVGENKADYDRHADNGWLAVIQHYFVSAIVPQPGLQREYFAKSLGNSLFAVGTILPLGTIAPGATVVNMTQLYSGPQDADVLDKIAPNLDLVKDYGMTTIIAKPIFAFMKMIHKVLGNWGWTIIALTVVIKLVFFPLSAASYRSMARMKSLSPKVTALRERLKGNPQEMNREMMALYKKEKVNPAGGCLPMVIQIPVFLALYSVLASSVELRNAPWIGWIHDLAAPDPFYILPIVMAVSMFIQTKLNPPPPDPTQAKIMMIMPLVFSVMFLFFASGLVLYWITNNILSITQQYVISKRFNQPVQKS